MKDLKNALAYYLPMILGIAAVYGGGLIRRLEDYWNSDLFWKWRKFCTAWRKFWTVERKENLRMSAYNGLILLMCILVAAMATIGVLAIYFLYWRGQFEL